VTQTELYLELIKVTGPKLSVVWHSALWLTCPNSLCQLPEPQPEARSVLVIWLCVY